MFKYWREHRDKISKPLFIHLAYVFAKRLIALENPIIEPIVLDINN